MVKSAEARHLAYKIGKYCIQLRFSVSRLHVNVTVWLYVGASAYVENSAKTGEGVQEVFQIACRAIMSPKKKMRKRTDDSSRCQLLW